MRIRNGDFDHHADTSSALAALRRGMELASAPAEPVDFDVEALAREVVDQATGYVGGKEIPPGRLELAEAAIRRTLAHRGARWPGEGEIADLATEIAIDIRQKPGGHKFDEAALEMARRLKARILGEPS
jgi:hypothetical protein